MAGVDKIIQKMKTQPNGISLEEAAKVLAANGYLFNRQKGSHCHYVSKNGDVITIVKQQPLKKAYVVAVLERIGEK
jgi:predicted RNA binding protein YcfA (HicA-like mRNA interferase family)